MKAKEREKLVKDAAAMAKVSLNNLYRSVLFIESYGTDGINSDKFKEIADGASDSTARLHSLLLCGEFEKRPKRKNRR